MFGSSVVVQLGGESPHLRFAAKTWRTLKKVRGFLRAGG